MEIGFFEEPELEFGAAHHIDMRFGIMNYGPVDFDEPTAPKSITLGIVGTNESIEGVRRWLDKCKDEIPAKKSNQPNLFPKFPGFGPERGFRSALILDSSLEKAISISLFENLRKETDGKKVIEMAVDLFIEEMKYLKEKRSPRVIICAVPQILLDIMRPVAQKNDEDDEGGEANFVSFGGISFHDMLKAKAMNIDVPIQLIIPSTYDEKKRRRQVRRSDLVRTLQDEATRAWNIHTALYYKAQGVPWRLLRSPSDYTTCYVGVSFYRALEGANLHTSVAQVFNERGQGIIVKGGQATISKVDRQPHLSNVDATSLLENALKTYKKEHYNFPARVVVHKSSVHLPEEREGFIVAAKSCGVDLIDLISLTKSFTRLFRTGSYPPLRGTFLSLDDQMHILYTRGSVDFFSTYPGMYVPRTLLIRCDQIEQTPRFLAQEILALTKMNWNNTQFDGGKPITMRTAEQVGRILKYIGKDDPMSAFYRFYM